MTRTADDVALEWSEHASLVRDDGAQANAFMLGTWAVKARWPDGHEKHRMLLAGLRSNQPGLPKDQEFAHELCQVMAAQEGSVVFEHAVTPPESCSHESVNGKCALAAGHLGPHQYI